VPKHLSMEANLVMVKIKSVCPNLLKYMDLFKSHGRVIILHNYSHTRRDSHRRTERHPTVLHEGPNN
jgi:hypothetical protein